jgi:uncharacterized YigZ family protein
MTRYLIPAERTRSEILVVNSRFIATIGPAFSVEQAREFIAEVRNEFADATHNVPAFIIGHGASVTTHTSDDGEPAGTAGRPALAVLTGSGLGDAVVVVTRYFGGTKLGKGGLVRAYSDAVRTVLSILPRAERVPTYTVMLAMPYSLFERARILVNNHGGQILDESFAADVTLTARFSIERFESFQAGLAELSNGTLQAEIIESSDAIVPTGTFGEADGGPPET